MGRRRQGREIALQALYLLDISSLTPRQALYGAARLSNPKAVDPATLEFTRAIVEGAREHLKEIDRHIQEAAQNWKMPRMGAVDRNILRLAAYEMLFRPDVPVKVAIDEAIEIARKFSTEESTKFINGVLDQIKKEANDRIAHGPQEDSR